MDCLEAPEFLGIEVHLNVKFRVFLPSLFVCKDTATHSKILHFSDSFAHWLQLTEGSSMVDCSIAMMLAIEKVSF